MNFCVFSESRVDDNYVQPCFVCYCGCIYTIFWYTWATATWRFVHTTTLVCPTRYDSVIVYTNTKPVETWVGKFVISLLYLWFHRWSFHCSAVIRYGLWNMLVIYDFLPCACCELVEIWKGSMIKWVVVVDGTSFSCEGSRLHRRQKHGCLSLHCILFFQIMNSWPAQAQTAWKI